MVYPSIAAFRLSGGNKYCLCAFEERELNFKGNAIGFMLGRIFSFCLVPYSPFDFRTILLAF